MELKDWISLIAPVIATISIIIAIWRAEKVRYQKKLNFLYKEINIAREKIFIFNDEYTKLINQQNSSLESDPKMTNNELKGEIGLLITKYLFLESGLFSSQFIKWDKNGKVKKVKIHKCVSIKFGDVQNMNKYSRKDVYKVLLNELKDLISSYREVHSYIGKEEIYNEDDEIIGYKNKYMTCCCDALCNGTKCKGEEISAFISQKISKTKDILDELSRVTSGHSKYQYKKEDFK